MLTRFNAALKHLIARAWGDEYNLSGDFRDATINIKSIIVDNTALTKAEQRDRRRKLILLDKVQKFWIEGVLEQSVYKAVLIELGKEVRPEAVDHPWDMVLETHDKEPRILLKGQKIGAIFAQMEHALLILGEPGSGKTVSLLELARETILLAEKDPNYPIPVIFNLSSWAERRQPLQDWLVEELSTKVLT
jgi:eukaryotic-like serine/threonine-protein kinase